MTFRPRYSLLAFLLFTAAIAGGVKLWRGPHHVVDRSNPQMEDEYTYYRDWNGTKVMDGVRVLRYVSNPNEYYCIKIFYYRAGERLDCHGRLTLSLVEENAVPYSSPNFSLLTNLEQHVFQQIILDEKNRVRQSGWYPLLDSEP